MADHADHQLETRLTFKAILGWGLVGVVAILVAAWLVWDVAQRWRLQLAARGFVEAEAVVTASRIVEQHGVDHRNSSYDEYEIHLSFEFGVDGQTHRVANCRWGPVERLVTRSKDEAEETRKSKYLPGMRITVYYDPADPTRVVETRQVSWGTLILRSLLAVGAVLLVGGMVYWGIATLVRQLVGQPAAEAHNATPPQGS